MEGKRIIRIALLLSGLSWLGLTSCSSSEPRSNIGPKPSGASQVVKAQLERNQRVNAYQRNELTPEQQRTLRRFKLIQQKIQEQQQEFIDVQNDYLDSRRPRN